MDNVVDLKKRKEANVITLDYKTLNSEGFNQALSMLSNQTGFSNFQAAYNVAKITKQHFEELKIARDLYNKWTDEYVVKDEAGVPKRAAKVHPLCPWEIKEGMEKKFDEELEKFLKTSVEIKARPLALNELGAIQLSPAQLISLEPIFAPESFETPQASPAH